MEHILVTGATGQIGAELVPLLRQRYGNDMIVAAGNRTKPSAELQQGPFITLDVTDAAAVRAALQEYRISKIFHLSSILSAAGETNPQLAYAVNFNGLYNILEAAREEGVKRVIVPSSIAAFGPGTPREQTPNDTIQRPTTIYGVSKVAGELLGNYYFQRFGLDVRGVRFPGILSWKVEPTAGTTDYAVAMFYGAVRDGRYTCYLREDTRLPMMYMPDAIRALIELEQADAKGLQHRADFNVAAMSFTPAELAEVIRKRIPTFAVDYQIDPLRQAIADSWPMSLDDSAARAEWDWEPQWDLERMADDLLANIRRKLGKQRGGREKGDEGNRRYTFSSHRLCRKSPSAIADVVGDEPTEQLCP
ncbi:MAG: NAD-dependent epimerase/dehydratase family protein [Candidatus Komeilibacteria bacterium]|nr:NAD-dependent epimerase/dehydratase family protein [Candidatus Komeilibacteria bacterium]